MNRTISTDTQAPYTSEPVLGPEACRTLSRPQEDFPRSRTRDTGATSSTTDEAGAIDDDIYNRFSPARKNIIVLTLCICGFLNPMSSTALLVAVPDIAETFHTTGAIINVSNAMFFVFMAISPTFWAPLLGVVGRRWIFIVCTVFLTAFQAGTAAAPNLAAFFACRMLGAFQGTTFLVAGSVVIGDIYRPEERGRALGWFMSGIVVGPSLAPLLGGIVIHFTHWRIIFWVLTGACALALCMVVTLLPETMHDEPLSFQGMSVARSAGVLAGLLNPWKVVRPLLTYPNLWIDSLAVSSLIWNMYALLTPIRYVLNPRFGITSSIESALFFLAPGLGYLSGTWLGGRWSDYNVNKYIKKRGRRVPEDRLNAAVWIMAVPVPGSIIVYGWAVDQEVGGIPLVVVALYLAGLLQQLSLPSLNTYCVDVMQEKGQASVTVAGNYLVRFLFAAGASAACLPAIDALGVGWFSTISALSITMTAGLVWLLTRHGERWRKAIDANEKT